MQELYSKSIEVLKKQDNTKITVKEWTKIAKENNLLTAKTMCKISGLKWRKLCCRVKYKYIY